MRFLYICDPIASIFPCSNNFENYKVMTTTREDILHCLLLAELETHHFNSADFMWVVVLLILSLHLSVLITRP